VFKELSWEFQYALEDSTRALFGSLYLVGCKGPLRCDILQLDNGQIWKGHSVTPSEMQQGGISERDLKRWDLGGNRR
jgi:hypothetical protein